METGAQQRKSLLDAVIEEYLQEKEQRTSRLL